MARHSGDGPGVPLRRREVLAAVPAALAGCTGDGGLPAGATVTPT